MSIFDYIDVVDLDYWDKQAKKLIEIIEEEEKSNGQESN